MAFKLAVLREVTRNKQNVWLVLTHGIEQLEVYLAAFREQLSVAVECIGEV